MWSIFAIVDFFAIQQSLGDWATSCVLKFSGSPTRQLPWFSHEVNQLDTLFFQRVVSTLKTDTYTCRLVPKTHRVAFDIDYFGAEKVLY